MNQDQIKINLEVSQVPSDVNQLEQLSIWKIMAMSIVIFISITLGNIYASFLL